MSEFVCRNCGHQKWLHTHNGCEMLIAPHRYCGCQQTKPHDIPPRLDMGKVLMTVAVILGFIVFGVRMAGASDYSELYAKTSRSVVVVYEPTTTNGGGGVVVSRISVVTSLHIVGDKTDVKVQFYDGTVADGRVASRDPGNDLALIHVTTPDTVRVATLDLAVPDIGDDVAVIGHPSGLFWSLSKGYLAFPRERRVDLGDGQTDVLQIHAPVFSGSSGGGLFSMEGNLLGIGKGVLATNTGNGRGGGDIAYFVPASAICQRLIRCKGNR